MEQAKELIWVSKEYAEEYKKLDTVQAQAKLAKEILEAKKIDISSEMSQLDDDLIRFKSACLIHKAEMEKVYKEQASLVEKLIEDCWDIMPKVKQDANKFAFEVKAELEPIGKVVSSLKEDVNSLKTSLNDLNIYGMNQVIDLANKLTQMDDNTKEILSFLVQNYKR